MIKLKIRSNFLLVCFSIIMLVLPACTATNPHAQDPFEGVNREVYGFNRAVDYTFVKPVAYVYDRYFPDILQARVSDWFNNFREVTTIANDLLQLKFGHAFHDTSRFLINTTVGLLGFYDVASKLGLDRRQEDFGQTLYHWGYDETTYLVLPFIGPSSIRDGAGWFVDNWALSIWPWIDSDKAYYGLRVASIIDDRAKLLSQEEVLDKIAVDEYAFVRDAFFQRREFLAKDGNVKTSTDGADPFDDEFFESDETIDQTDNSTHSKNSENSEISEVNE